MQQKNTDKKNLHEEKNNRIPIANKEYTCTEGRCVYFIRKGIVYS